MDAEPCGATGCLTCPMLGPDWRAEVARQLAMPDPIAEALARHARRRRRPNQDDATLAWLTDGWRHPREIARSVGLSSNTVCARLFRLRDRCPERIDYSRALGYRLRRSA